MKPAFVECGEDQIAMKILVPLARHQNPFCGTSIVPGT
jgi:hypothetical protein